MVMHIPTVNISQIVIDRQTLLLLTNRESHTALQLKCLHLILAHSKGQGQGHAHFNCENHHNGKNMLNITVAIREVAYGLSIRIFRFNIGSI